MDFDSFRDTAVVPEDAGEYADQLLAVMNRIPVGWGRWISCARGWYKLIIETDEKMKLLCPDYQILQVKEKFGGLRFYWSVPDNAEVLGGEANRAIIKEIMYDIETQAERRSVQICELCGERAITRARDYWYKTLCATCAVENNYPLEDWEKESRNET